MTSKTARGIILWGVFAAAFAVIAGAPGVGADVFIDAGDNAACVPTPVPRPGDGLSCGQENQAQGAPSE